MFGVAKSLLAFGLACADWDAAPATQCDFRHRKLEFVRVCAAVVSFCPKPGLMPFPGVLPPTSGGLFLHLQLVHHSHPLKSTTTQPLRRTARMASRFPSSTAPGGCPASCLKTSSASPRLRCKARCLRRCSVAVCPMASLRTAFWASRSCPCRATMCPHSWTTCSQRCRTHRHMWLFCFASIATALYPRAVCSTRPSPRRLLSCCHGACSTATVLCAHVAGCLSLFVCEVMLSCCKLSFRRDGGASEAAVISYAPRVCGPL